MTDAVSTSGAVKVGLSVAGLLIAAFLAYRALTGSHEVGDRAFYYDESERKLYVGPAGQFPPLGGIGGASGDGVIAMVYTCTEDPSKADRQIAYLQKFTPELVAKLEANEQEHKATGTVTQPLDRGYMTEQTLVRRVDEEAWHSQSSPEGQEIISVLSRRCDNGQFPRLCSPDE